MELLAHLEKSMLADRSTHQIEFYVLWPSVCNLIYHYAHYPRTNDHLISVYACIFILRSLFLFLSFLMWMGETISLTINKKSLIRINMWLVKLLALGHQIPFP